MIRSYSISELEGLTATNKRTIGDYVTKGLLAGPSHRGRGAVYSHRDLDVLKIIPHRNSKVAPNTNTFFMLNLLLILLSLNFRG